MYLIKYAQAFGICNIFGGICQYLWCSSHITWNSISGEASRCFYLTVQDVFLRVTGSIPFLCKFSQCSFVTVQCRQVALPSNSLPVSMNEFGGNNSSLYSEARNGKESKPEWKTVLDSSDTFLRNVGRLSTDTMEVIPLHNRTCGESQIPQVPAS
jgi:hypothetical protein